MGPIVARGSETYAYDQANRLSTATVNGVTETYVYDGAGTRYSRQVGAGSPIRYVSDIGGALPNLIDDGAHKYVFGVGLSYAVSGSAIEVYHADRLTSTRAITNASGTVTAAYRTDEWGVPRASSGSSTQPFGYSGEPTDGTGLSYLRARYYNPDLGRFMSRDTWFGSPSKSTTLNRFAFANDDPVTNTDPTGHFVDIFADAAFIVMDIGGLVFGPPKDRLGNWLALGADIGGVFIPFVTGGGIAARAGLKASEHVDDAGDVIRYIGEGAAAMCSFAPETFVATPDGSRRISSIRPGDTVLAWDQVTNALVERTVTAASQHRDTEVAVVTVDGATITTTPDHPFYTLEDGWIEAGQLRLGTHVKARIGSGVVDSVTTASYRGSLWNLTVQGAHTFFVGTEELLVHNSCPVTSAIGKDSRIAREAERAGKSVQTSLDSLTAQLMSGNRNPGIGTKHLFGNVFEARARDGARVYFTQAGDAIQIVGKSDKSNQDRVISLLQELYGG
ncbi:MAG TPA: RHS repeat-associated core domain-containing protein [Candidatus Limnocylindrales bacterium]|nr:RHS repeat-associated core domain-containing protein [Candidatus Limnocylindrales bacterium]